MELLYRPHQADINERVLRNDVKKISTDELQWLMTKPLSELAKGFKQF